MLRIILIVLLFAFIHSITVSKGFKSLCRRTLGDTFMRVFYRACYSLVSIVTAGAALYLIYRIPDEKLWTAPAWLQWILYAAQGAGAVFGLLAFEHIDGGEFLGVKQVWRYFSRREIAGNSEGLTQKELITAGVYGIVRNPLYLAGIVIFTCSPSVTRNSLTVTVLADLYFLFGAVIEERRFSGIFGDKYREYRERVPLLVPRIGSRKKRA